VDLRGPFRGRDGKRRGGGKGDKWKDGGGKGKGERGNGRDEEREREERGYSPKLQFLAPPLILLFFGRTMENEQL